MKKYSRLKLVLIFTPFVFSFAFGLDIYIPIVPQMAEIFNTSQALVQLTLSLFLLVTGIGQLIIGPLSDQVGRRPIFYGASILFALGSVLCACSPTIYFLILGRISSSLGACGMLVTSFAVVRDLYSGEESAKIYSLLHGAIGISPTFAPIIGGYLSVYWGWPSVFIFLALIGLLSFIITRFFIKESLEQEARIKLNRKIFKRYRDIFHNHNFLIYATLAGFAESIFFGFFSSSPFLIIDELGVSTDEFGYYFAIFGCVIAFGGVLSAYIINLLGNKLTLALGIFLMGLGGLSMLSWYYWAGLSLVGFLWPMVIACTGAVFLLGGAAALALEPFGDMAGTAAAAFGALEFGISAFIGFILMLFPASTTVPYACAIILLAFLSGAFLGSMRFREENKSQAQSAYK